MSTEPHYVVKKVVHDLGLPTRERCMPNVLAPPREKLLHDRLFVSDPGAGQTVRIEVLREFLAEEGRLHSVDVLAIIHAAAAIFRREPTVVTVSAPVTICGDIHGQYYDLLRLLEVGGSPECENYLFLGDYIDRGCFSVEVLLLLYALKTLHPNSFFLLRGNHECRHMAEFFTFRAECLAKYNADVYEAFIGSFQTLPLAAVVNKQFFCVHGGISPEIKTVDDVKKINRFREPPSFGPMCDVLWADPAPEFVPIGGEHFGFNDVRGCSYVYTYHAVNAFLERNKLLSIVRAHEAQDDGYQMLKMREPLGFPAVITIFSAPNYLDAYNNKGAVLHYNTTELNIRQFNASPHPYWLPNFSNAITWSLPFVVEKIAELQLSLLKICDDEQDEQCEKEEEELTDHECVSRRIAIRDKIRSVTKFLRMYSTLRDEADSVNRLKTLTSDSSLPKGVLLGGRLAVQQMLCDFEVAQTADRPNLKRPPLPRACPPSKAFRPLVTDMSFAVPDDQPSLCSHHLFDDPLFCPPALDTSTDYLPPFEPVDHLSTASTTTSSSLASSPSDASSSTATVFDDPTDTAALLDHHPGIPAPVGSDCSATMYDLGSPTDALSNFTLT